MTPIKIFILVITFTAPLAAQTRPNNDDIAGGIPREEVPLAVIWGLSAYSGFTTPYAPDAFADFWKPSANICLEADILLRNDFILGMSMSYTKLPFNQQEYWAHQGIMDDYPDVGFSDDFDIPISQVLFSFKGIENYLLHQYRPVWEVGVGLYHLKNTEIDVTYITNYDYVLSKSDRLYPGLFAGFGMSILITETLQFAVKGRFHHVLQLSRDHEFIEVLFGLKII